MSVLVNPDKTLVGNSETSSTRNTNAISHSGIDSNILLIARENLLNQYLYHSQYVNSIRLLQSYRNILNVVPFPAENQVFKEKSIVNAVEIVKKYNKKDNFNFNSAQNVNNLIFGIFNPDGSIPTIKIENTRLQNGTIKYLDPLDFKNDTSNNPVISFTDGLGRTGFALCAKNSQSEYKVQSFYQEMKNSPNWVWSGAPIIPFSGKYIIENGVVNSSLFQLHLLVNEKQINLGENIWTLEIPSHKNSNENNKSGV